MTLIIGNYSLPVELLSKHLDISYFPIPGNPMPFSKVVLHLFFRCVSDSQTQTRDKLEIPPPTSWPTILPAFSTLETYQHILLGEQSSRLAIELWYLG
ncbi:hypothetical protein PM082_015602 [Marasmius tenuissimus]|nr:hypothetical protein PM082_015602 [Marasmius tenuissimus]